MFEKVRKIMSAEEVKEKVPLSQNLQKIKKDRDIAIKDILSGKDKRLLFIIGPCSADNEDAVCDYALRLAKLSEKIKSQIYVIPRIYTNKPRTRGEGYKGMLHSPDPHKGTDIQAGILALRHMHLRVMSESGLTSADEMLYPDNYAYLDDLLAYVAIGARSTENQQHRLVASGIDIPVGVKNPMNGSFPVTLNSIYASQISNEFKYHDYQVKTSGNKFAHALLRGSVDVFGNNIPNYHYEDLLRFSKMYLEQNLANPAVIVDSNHSNSNKEPLQQVRIVREVLNNMLHCDVIGKIVKGFLIESYIEDGNQSADSERYVYGKSITDGCLGWQKTEKLLLTCAEELAKR